MTDSFFNHFLPYKSKLESLSKHITINKNQFLFFEGDSFDGFYVVVSGKLRVFNSNEEGEESTVSIVETGQMISAVPVLIEIPYFHAHCQALVDSELLFFAKEPFKHFLIQNSVFQFDFSKLVLKYLLKIREKYLGLTLKNASQRFLDFMKNIGAESKFVKIPVAKKHLASLLDISPESLSRIIKNLEEQKILIKKSNLFKISALN